MKKEVLKDLLGVMKGLTPPDTVVRNGKVVNVFTNRVEEDLMIVIRDGYIVSVEEDNGVVSYEAPNVVDAEGLYLCPGFIDAHTHLDGIYPFHELVPYALRGGTTTVVSECCMVACASGMPGVMSFVESTKGYPLRCYFVAPPLTPPFPKMETALGLTFKEFSKLLKREDFLGIGEGYWTSIVEGDDRVLKQVALALSLHKIIDGHSAGARGRRLTEYVLTGITSCHESVTLEEALEKLRLGVYIMIREGFVRKELRELSKLKNADVDKRRIMLVSDVFDAVMLCEEGYLDSVVRSAIGYGFSPIEAIRMVTINVADYYGSRFLGAIAPLRKADMLFLKDLRDISVQKVMVNGDIVFADGRLTAPIAPYNYPEEMKHTIQLEQFTEDDFKIASPPGGGMVRVIEATNQTVTREKAYKLKARDGFLIGNSQQDIIPVAVINRRNRKNIGRAFIQGTGIKHGAIATTLIWDTANILTIGSDEKEMAQAVNRLVDVQGGTVISKNGTIIYEMAMPVYGLIPLNNMEQIKEKTKELEKKFKEIGTALERPFLTLQTIPFTGLPFLRITDRGLVDIKNKKLVSLFL